MTRTVDVRRALVLTHRWLGIAGGVLVVLWFVSGIVMMYARMPVLGADERLARLAPLDLSTLTVAPARAAEAVGGSRGGPTLGMLGDRPVYRFGTVAVFGDTGERLDTLGRERALRVAADFGGDRARSLEYGSYLTAPDQWTLQDRGSLPMHRVRLGDDAGTHLYVADGTGEVVLDTNRSERRWAYAGAVLHWLYFTPFRVHTGLWVQTIIWLAILGCLLTLSGLAWGVWRFSWRVPAAARSPYHGLLRWHHYAGLAFGLVTFTWILSGGLSMDPWSWHPGTAPTAGQRSGVADGPLSLSGIDADALQTAVATMGPERTVRELSFVRFAGRTYLSMVGGDPAEGTLMVPASDPRSRPFARFSNEAMHRAARQAMPGVPIVDEVWLDEPDSYYYGRYGSAPPLPVLRVRYLDPQETWLYLDPRRGAVVRKEERLTRLNRWLYHGLHSLDFPFLYRSRPLWDVVVIVLSLGGLALAATTLQPGWARLMGHSRRLRG